MTTHTTTTNEQDRKPHDEADKRARWNLRALIARGPAALMAAGVFLATPRAVAAQPPPPKPETRGKRPSESWRGP